MIRDPRSFSSILVGGGPAGLAVLLSAQREGRLRDLLQRGLLIVERGSTLGAGQIGSYSINSDSTGDTFVDPLRSASEPALRQVLHSPVAQRIASAGSGAVPLTDVGELMALMGEAFRSILAEHPNCAILTGCTAESAQSQPGGGWQVAIHGSDGVRRAFFGRNLILATGAAQPARRLQQERVAGAPVMRWAHKLVQSGDVLVRGGLEKTAAFLAGRMEPKVAILGGSTSGMAAAHALLHRMPGTRFTEGGVTLFHRKPIRVYYPGVSEALADGYADFGIDDLCPVTNRLYRFAGLRLDSRELMMQVCGLGGCAAEPRLRLHQLQQEEDAAAIRAIDAADLVIAAFGYRPNGLPLLDPAGQRISLLAHSGPAAPLVDDRCRILNGDGRPVTGAYAIGLAAGFRPKGKFGGEPSFQGQVNGLWVWQNGVGSIIANAILDRPAVSTMQPVRPPATPAQSAEMLGMWRTA